MRGAVVRIVTPVGSGSGFVVDARQDLIVTNEHVVEGYSSVEVAFDDGVKIPGHVIGHYATADVALIRITATRSLLALSFADEADQREQVIALGFPRAYTIGNAMTMTVGFVSAFRTYDGVLYIQTDAAINPGNSGGPLLNLDGEVVGMNTAKVLDAEGLGFAIRFDSLLPVVEYLRAGTDRTVTPTATPVASPAPSAELRWGPVDGEIEHNSTGDFIDSYDADDVWLTDGIIEATFFNPYDSAVGAWDHGFIFREFEEAFYVVFITDYGYYYHYLRMSTDQVDDEPLASAYISEANTGAGESNHIRIVVDGAQGELYVSGAHVASLHLGGLTGYGWVSAVATYFTDSGVDGYSTEFGGFTIWRLTK